MLMYVIPLVILIVVLIIVKKRQDANAGSNQPAKKVNNKSKSKKTASTRTNSRPSQVVQDPIIETKATQPLAPETRKKIETLIQDRNFFAAEAQINQALNRNNAQHELYLLLLDVHLKQNDDFAINQLLNHLRSLELSSILSQAETKIAEANGSASDDVIQFVPSSASVAENEVKATPTYDAKSDSAFDELIGTSSTYAEKEQSAPANEINIPEVELDISSFESDIDVDRENGTAIQEKTLEFDSAFNASTPKPVEETQVVEDIKPLDFSFSLTPNEDISTEKTVDLQPATTVDDATPPEFKFTIDEPSVSDSVEVETANTNSIETELNFDGLETSQIEISSNEESSSDSLLVESLTSTDFTNTTSFETTSAYINESIDSSDPLVNAFPALTTSDEATLNIELAQKYIELGAYEAARSILSETQIEYSSEQRETANQLLNQIAS